MKYINELVKEIKWRGRPMKPCTQEQMCQLMSIVDGKKLPQAYLEFMSTMGNYTEGCFMRGESCFMDEIFELKLWALELLEECKSKHTLSDEEFVFWMSQGCAFCFFRLGEGENPPVYFYQEDNGDEIIKIAYTFTEFMMNYLDNNKNTFAPK